MEVRERNRQILCVSGWGHASLTAKRKRATLSCFVEQLCNAKTKAVVDRELSTVRLGAFSVALNPVPLSASQTRNAKGIINPTSGGTLTLQIAGTLTAGTQVVSNGGSCVATAPVIQ